MPEVLILQPGGASRIANDFGDGNRKVFIRAGARNEEIFSKRLLQRSCTLPIRSVAKKAQVNSNCGTRMQIYPETAMGEER